MGTELEQVRSPTSAPKPFFDGSSFATFLRVRTAFVCAGVIALAIGGAACGSSKASTSAAGGAKRNAQPAPHTARFALGAFDDLPLLPSMRAAGSTTRVGAVTTRTFRVPSETPSSVITAYAKLLVNWSASIVPHRVGTTDYQGAFRRNGYSLVVTTANAPALDNSTGATLVSQISLELFNPGTPPSTFAP